MFFRVHRVAALAVFAFCLSSFAAQANLKPLKAVADWAYPPYQFLDENERPKGFSIELLQTAFNAMNRPLKIEMAPLKKCEKMLEDGEADLLAGVLATPELAQKFALCDPIATVRFVRVVREGNDKKLSFTAMGPDSRVLDCGGVVEAYMGKHSEAKFIQKETPADALRALVDGEGDIAVLPAYIARDQIRRLKLKGLRMYDCPFSLMCTIAVQPGHTELVQHINHEIAKLRSSGEFDEIVNHWIVYEDAHEAEQIAEETFFRILWPALFLLAILAGNSLYLHKTLKRKSFELEMRDKERAEMQRKLTQVQKMKSLALLSDGIAHNFNNILQGINGYTELIELNVKPDSEEAQDLKSIRGLTARAEARVRQLTAFCGGEELFKQADDINALVSETAQILRNTLSDNIQMEMHLCANLPRFLFDFEKMGHVVLNLCINAKEAIGAEPDGKIVVTTENIAVKHSLALRFVTLPPGDYVAIKISDNGNGIAEDQLEQIFSPFYTTKPFSLGGGLGLSVCYGIVKQHNGYIDVESTVGKGTTFSVYLKV